jgi:hypothetical protein
VQLDLGDLDVALAVVLELGVGHGWSVGGGCCGVARPPRAYVALR